MGRSSSSEHGAEEDSGVRQPVSQHSADATPRQHWAIGQQEGWGAPRCFRAHEVHAGPYFSLVRCHVPAAQTSAK